MKPDIKEIIAKCRRLEADHPPNGWPAIQMSDITRLCDEIERMTPAYNTVEEYEKMRRSWTYERA